jgi:hypothetical protein
MQNDKAKKIDETAKSGRAADTGEQLPQQPVSDTDAEAVKGGTIVYQSPQSQKR